MRVPAFSFILHLFAATSLLGSAFHHDSNSSKHSANRQLRAQDSRAKTKVIGDEERMIKFPFNLNVPEPTRSIEIPLALHLLSEVRGQQGITTSAGPSQIRNNDLLHHPLVAQMRTVVAEPHSEQTILKLIQDFNTAWHSIHGGMHVHVKPSSHISQLNPYILKILTIALRLKSEHRAGIEKDSWISTVNDLISFGFTRKEVEVLLRTAGNNDVEGYMASYDQMMSAMPTENILNFMDLNFGTTLTTFDVNFARRSVELLASIAKIVGQARLPDRSAAWGTALDMWFQIENVETDPERVRCTSKYIETAVLNVYSILTTRSKNSNRKNNMRNG
ncbi:hypothetical protein Plhal304r1_c022g0077551 [Plasmopara halstedii]